ncbi:MAG: hypothetical protein WBQ94_02855 [Terracidiphilus sp.]
MPFDLQLIEAKLALGMIGPDEMPALAWDALEAGLDGRSIRRLAALIQPSGWETDQILAAFMAEAGMKSISPSEASIRVARQLARRILSEKLDPLAYSRDFELLWIKADYPTAIQEVGSLDDQKAVAEYIGQSEAELRDYARSVLSALVATGETEAQS